MNPLTPDQLEQLRQLDSCSVANAIETFDVRLRNKGFTDSRIRCLFEDLPPMVGYAATARVRTAEPPMEGHNYYYRLDWLDHVLSIPSPRIIILEDLDTTPGVGAFIGDVHLNILAALGCVGVVTNGAVRNVEAAKAIQTAPASSCLITANAGWAWCPRTRRAGLNGTNLVNGCKKPAEYLCPIEAPV